MERDVDCMILWHYFNAEGKLMNASATHLVGSMANLQERLQESYDECRKDQEAKRPYVIAMQIIPKRN